ncbi:hypothetical protein DAEQUDRAFT_691558 [Daedalea quercina L-15889]|uniref:Zinc-ribbon 15 domain-containing protein n=1 Tax=Daedalea quercina L-15889 TaxID=1314783 RepID=A0A165Q565_9APHY|nr:hypothetical protein DAEQUDRAFT_691558 [Daedalea quercina L-15889]
MDFIFCLPIMFGCPTRIKAHGDQTPRICPRCNNVSVTGAKSRLWFELCWVPLIPMKSNRIWMCSICQWNIPLQPNWEPAFPGGNFQPGGRGTFQPGPYPPQSGDMNAPPSNYQSGYQPGYISQAHTEAQKEPASK